MHAFWGRLVCLWEATGQLALLIFVQLNYALEVQLGGRWNKKLLESLFKQQLLLQCMVFFAPCQSIFIFREKGSSGNYINGLCFFLQRQDSRCRLTSLCEYFQLQCFSAVSVFKQFGGSFWIFLCHRDCSHYWQLWMLSQKFLMLTVGTSRQICFTYIFKVFQKAGQLQLSRFYVHSYQTTFFTSVRPL